MTQYIDKDALVAEIEKLENRYKKCSTRNSYEEGLKYGRLIGYKDALHKINTLEVKEVDLEKHLKEEALKFIEENTKYRYVRGIGSDGCLSRSIDPDKEYYIEPWVAKEAVEIALKKKEE